MSALFIVDEPKEIKKIAEYQIDLRNMIYHCRHCNSEIESIYQDEERTIDVQYESIGFRGPIEERFSVDTESIDMKGELKCGSCLAELGKADKDVARAILKHNSSLREMGYYLNRLRAEEIIAWAKTRRILRRFLGSLKDQHPGQTITVGYLRDRLKDPQEDAKPDEWEAVVNYILEDEDETGRIQ